MTDFLQVLPNTGNRWRAIILFGRNTASFKFALAEALLAFGRTPHELVRLDELALPYAKAICRHLQAAPKQITTQPGRFINACLAWNHGEIGDEALRDTTVRLGFANVIDAFHNIGGDLGTRFYVDERRENRGIRLTDAFLALADGAEAGDLGQEVEARWRLVETAWELGVAAPLISYDHGASQLHTDLRGRRANVASARDALNGYQKGRCFYCFGRIGIVPGCPDLADVDHFLPHVLGVRLGMNLDGVWNLVLACAECNRGSKGKFDRVPDAGLLARLHARNEFYIGSHHPLRETLVAQTGRVAGDRAGFLRRAHAAATALRVARWQPTPRAEAAF